MMTGSAPGVRTRWHVNLALDLIGSMRSQLADHRMIGAILIVRTRHSLLSYHRRYSNGHFDTGDMEHSGAGGDC